MRPIKFRGRIAKDHVEKWKRGEIICGSLMVFADAPITGCTHWIIDEKSKPYRNYPVNENSIAQLVGYDRDGNEVYEGDKVTSEVYEGEFVARLTSDPPYPILQEVAKMTVKETEP